MTELKQMIDEFVAIASHELDGPLRKMSVYVDALEQQPVNEQGRVYLERITRSLSAMRSLVDDLSSLTSLANDEAEPGQIRLGEILDGAMRELGREMESGNASVSVGELPVIRGQRWQWELLFRNLLRNAITFTQPGIAPQVSIHSGPVAEEEKTGWGLDGNIEYVKILVTDNGRGFESKDEERIFEPFVRLHGKSAYPGNGIGLALCRRVAENHRGIIFARQPGHQGAQFIIVIPQN